MEVIVVLAFLFGLYMAWNIGANDVANAMGTSVGSKALTLGQALLVAGFLEFAGAFLVGSHVTETLKQKYFDAGMFTGSAELLAAGMLAVLLSSGIWLQVATFFGWPVSTTHAIVGSLVGFAIAGAGLSSVNWASVTITITAWIISPLLGGILAFAIFSLIRSRIINQADPIRSAKRYAPYLIFAVFFVLSLVTLWKGMANLKLSLTPVQSLLSASLIAFAAASLGNQLIRRYAEGRVVAGDTSHVNYQFVFVEKVFGYLQIISACSVAFAHGANDVANAVGPLAAIYSLAKEGAIVQSAPVPPFMLAIGGLGIVAGLATWGYRVIRTVGERITELTPTRGFAAEFGASCTIVLASRIGLPISTTHTLVGAVLGVGLARGVASINLKVFREILISWLITVPVSGILSAILYSLIKVLFF